MNTYVYKFKCLNIIMYKSSIIFLQHLNMIILTTILFLINTIKIITSLINIIWSNFASDFVGNDGTPMYAFEQY